MTLFLVLAVITGAIVALLTAIPLSAATGLTRASCIGIILAIELICYILAKWRIVSSARPICRKGKCKGGDYEAIGFARDLGIANKGLVVKCRCGDRYLQTSNVFAAIDDRGNLNAYKIRSNILAAWRNSESREEGNLSDLNI